MALPYLHKWWRDEPLSEIGNNFEAALRAWCAYGEDCSSQKIVFYFFSESNSLGAVHPLVETVGIAEVEEALIALEPDRQFIFMGRKCFLFSKTELLFSIGNYPLSELDNEKHMQLSFIFNRDLAILKRDDYFWTALQSLIKSWEIQLKRSSKQ